MAQHGISGIGDLFGLSDTIWNDVPMDYIFGLGDRNYGWGVRDDFEHLSLATAISTGVAYYQSGNNYYRTYEESNTSTSTQALEDGGSTYTVPTGFPILTPQGANAPQTTLQGTQNILFPAGAIIPTPGQLATVMTAAVSDRAQMMASPMTTATGASTSYNVCPFTPYSAANQVPSKVYFECRLSFSTLNTTLSNFFIGLCSGGANVGGGTSASPLASNTAYATIPALLGFGFLTGYTEGDLSIVFNKAGGTIQDEKVTNGTSLNLINMETYAINGVNVLGSSTNKTAACYFKLGFTVDFTPKGGNGTFTPFINGLAFDGRMAPSKLITNVANNPTAPDGTKMGTTTWPATPMNLCFGLFQHSTGTALNLTLDWWAAAQVF